jgi:hypothetical protein
MKYSFSNPEKLNKMNLLSIKKMLLNYIKDNCFAIKINKNIDKFTILVTLYNSIIRFIINNSKYLDIKTTKYALLSIFKDYIKLDVKGTLTLMLYQVFFENYLFEKNIDKYYNGTKFAWCVYGFVISPGINLISNATERTYFKIYGSKLKDIVRDALNHFSNYDEIFDKNGTNYEQLLYQWPICNGAGDQIDFPRPILIDCCLKEQFVVPTQSVCM